MSDDELRGDIEMFGMKNDPRKMLVNLLLCAFGVPDSVVLLPQGVWEGRTEYDEIGWIET